MYGQYGMFFAFIEVALGVVSEQILRGEGIFV